jgi:hypothetical protein
MDFFDILDHAPAEVAALRQALSDGQVNGSTYTGKCACLVGTIANAHGLTIQGSAGEVIDCGVSPIRLDASRPAEQWFMAIVEGDKPGDETEGGFRAEKAVAWIDEWVALRTAAATVLVAGEAA